MNEVISPFPQSAEELKTFLGMHIDSFTRHAWYILENQEDAEDVVQETVIRAFRMKKQLFGVKNPAAYLFRMVNNASIDHLRRRSTREKAAISLHQVSNDDYSEPREESLIREEKRQQLRSLLNHLPEEQAEVIRYRFADELTFQEIADILEINLATVKSRFSYGMTKLRSKVNEQKEVYHDM
ncbi:MAG: RNA polymerase sigma factor [Bacteroidetes bacterium]|nr:RNA polymerase sigma factor [Bacteroidota bacterium]